MGKGAKESRMKKVLRFPVRLLAKARDFYVNGMSQLSDQMRYDAIATMGLGCPAHMGSTALPRSFSVGVGGSTRSDYSELVRAASVRDNLGKQRRNVSQKQSPPAAGKGSSGMRGAAGAGKVPRSHSVGLGRIEEEETSDDLGEDCTSSLRADGGAFSRSRSCAVSAAGGVLARSKTGKFQKLVAETAAVS